ncbi:MAG: hypothetical protein GXO84_10685 [Chlorobi bacterium]|nr:hypothetical protein [Chlorobiota bacterium]
MIKTFSIAMSFLLLIQSLYINIADVVHLDELIEHANFHKQEYDDNFFVFLSKHYGDLKIKHEKRHQEEKEDHEKLPFQNDINLVVLIDYMFHEDKEAILKEKFLEEKQSLFYYQNIFSTHYKAGVFQPPRIV